MNYYILKVIYIISIVIFCFNLGVNNNINKSTFKSGEKIHKYTEINRKILNKNKDNNDNNIYNLQKTKNTDIFINSKQNNNYNTFYNN